MFFSWNSAIHVLWKRESDAAGFSPEQAKWHLSASDLRSENSLCSSLSCSTARLCLSVVVNPFTMGFISHIGRGGWPFLTRINEGTATKSGLRNPPIKNSFIRLPCGANQCGFN